MFTLKLILKGPSEPACGFWMGWLLLGSESRSSGTRTRENERLGPGRARLARRPVGAWHSGIAVKIHMMDHDGSINLLPMTGNVGVFLQNCRKKEKTGRYQLCFSCIPKTSQVMFFLEAIAFRLEAIATSNATSSSWHYY